MSCVVETLTAQYDQSVRKIIEQVGAEFGAVGEGYGPSDPEVLCMSQHYGDETKSVYLVALLDGEVVGGCGLASFNGSSEVCELKKLFILPKGRGHGLGKKMSMACLDYARTQGYQHCYLDTLSAMKVAIRLYESLGFEHLEAPLDGTLHNACDVWMLKSLTE